MNKKLYFRNKNNPLPDGQLSEFAQRLKQLREELGLSQEQLSKTIGLSKSTYRTYEIDQALPDAETIRNLAQYFHVSTDYLLGINNLKCPKPLNKHSHIIENCFSSSLALSYFFDIQYKKELKLIFEKLLSNHNFVDLLLILNDYDFFCKNKTYLTSFINESSYKNFTQYKYLNMKDITYTKLHAVLDKMLQDIIKEN